MKNLLLSSVAFLSLTSCSDWVLPPKDIFFAGLTSLCDQKFEGLVVEGNENDDTWRKSRIIAGPGDCSDVYKIKIPLSVGEDTSRTWIITLEDGDLTLQHDHRHEDGTPDDITMYGGTATEDGTFTRQEFPADQYSKDIFLAHGLDVSVNNTWVLTIEMGTKFSYRLERPGRAFQIDFDLTKPIK